MEDVNKIQIGDVVRIGSSPNLMTVNSIIQDKGNAYCMWFDNDLKITKEYFNIDALVLVHKKSRVPRG